MKNTNRTKSRKSSRRVVVIIGIAVAVLVLAGAGLWFVKHRHDQKQNISATSSKKTTRPVNSVDYSPSTPTDNAANNTRKDNPSSAASTLDNGPTAQSGSSSLSVTVVRAGVVGSQFQVGTTVSGTTTGTCTLKISESEQSDITQTNQVAQQGNNYACAVFNVPVSSFPNSGPWNVSVSVTSSGTTATAAWAGNPVHVGE